MLLFKVISRIIKHPLNKRNKIKALTRFVKWQLGTKLLPYPMIYPLTVGSKLIIKKGLTGATGNFYSGLDEFHDMGFLLHLLRKEDLFVDIGANIGSYTMLASAEIGSASISIEPNERAFNLLLENIRVNSIESLTTPLNVGLGRQEGLVMFTNTQDTINHVATAGESKAVETKIDTLDNVLLNKEPLLLKVDVEGYELEVFQGALQTMNRSSLQAIIVELVGHGERYGFKDEDVHDLLTKSGFEPYSYDPFTRSLNKKTGFDSQNTLYIKDFDFVSERLQKAKEVTINQNTF